MSHLHLDCVGGIAGDMFVAAMIDAFPALQPRLDALMFSLPVPASVTVSIVSHSDGVLSGTRFIVSDSAPDEHDHRHASEIISWIRKHVLDPQVAHQAVVIFEVLAVAEGAVHGIDPVDVTFHEVGAWDSIVDVVAAAAMIAWSETTSSSVSPIPVGSGRAHSQHGMLPIPAPAVVSMLEGFVVFDDGLAGERVTPTGAAILRSLQPTMGAPKQPRVQGSVGVGFGMKKFEGISNIVRVRQLVPVEASASADLIAVLEFEIDDQTSEDLAVGLDHLRREDGVLDVLQYAGFGKKNRMCTCIRMLVKPDAVDSVCVRVFDETTTLGIRTSISERRVLERTMYDLGGLRVKVVERPDGRTAKADIDDVADALSTAQRGCDRWALESVALSKETGTV